MPLARRLCKIEKSGQAANHPKEYYAQPHYGPFTEDQQEISQKRKKNQTACFLDKDILDVREKIPERKNRLAAETEYLRQQR